MEHINTTKHIEEALTFDDVLLIPAYSEVLPREVDILSKIIRINIPGIVIDEIATRTH